MKYLLAAIGANALSITCAIFSGYLIMHDKDGWGWFLVVALFSATSIRFREKS